MTKMGLAVMAYNGYNVPVRRLAPKGSRFSLVAAAGARDAVARRRAGCFPAATAGSRTRAVRTSARSTRTARARTRRFLTSALGSVVVVRREPDRVRRPRRGHQRRQRRRQLPRADRMPRPAPHSPRSRSTAAAWRTSRGGIIYTSQSFGGGELPLTTGGADVDPAYSPDGTKIAFARNSGGASGFDIWTINVSTGVLHQVTNAVGDERTPTWSPSGLSIVYSAGSTHELFGAASSTSGIPTPTDLNATGTDPAFSPDGTLIAFVNTGGPSRGDDEYHDADGHRARLERHRRPARLGGHLGADRPAADLIHGAARQRQLSDGQSRFGDTAPTLGDFLTASVGTWNGAFPFTYTYQWKRCDAADPLNGQCIDIAGANVELLHARRGRLRQAAARAGDGDELPGNRLAELRVDGPGHRRRAAPPRDAADLRAEHVDQTLSV